MSRKKKRPDIELFHKYEAFHSMNLEWVRQFADTDDDEASDAYCEMVWAQWDGMLDHLMKQQPKTPAGLALLALACLHNPQLQVPDGEAYEAWDGYEVPSFLDIDNPEVKALACLAEYALQLAPEVKERRNAA